MEQKEEGAGVREDKHIYPLLSFIFISLVIESLDIMKKDRSNYGARDAIKFLEKELQDSNRFLRAQTDSEMVDTSNKRRPHKEEIDVWYVRL